MSMQIAWRWRAICRGYRLRLAIATIALAAFAPATGATEAVPPVDGSSIDSAPSAQAAPADLMQELKARGRLKVVSDGRLHAGKTRSADRPAKNPALASFSDQEIFQSLQKSARGLFGEDNRRDLFQLAEHTQSNRAILENARSVAAFVDKSQLRKDAGGRFLLIGPTLKDANNLCDGEKFARQPACAYCTGFLVAPDLIATAGHCIQQGDDKASSIVFDFKMGANGYPQIRFSPDQIYELKEVVTRVYDGDRDWALVRLDRPVAGRQPLKVRLDGQVADGTGLYVLGYPEGLPQKYAGGGKVINNKPEFYFTMNTDTLQGNSGSPVFNASTHEVEGINVRGQRCLFEIWRPDGKMCSRYLSFDEKDVMGNNVIRYPSVLKSLPLEVKRRHRAR